jgi:hypothetical protein
MIQRVLSAGRRTGQALCALTLIALALAFIPVVAGPLRAASAAPATTQAYTWQNVVTGGGGGFVDDVIFNPGQKDLIYARTDIGGAYRWNPASSTWTQLLGWVTPDQWNWAGVESLASDPVNPNRLYIAAGLYTNSWTTMNGAILRSGDQGKTFQITQLPFKVGGNMPGRGMGERLAVDPNDDAILYYGTRSGHGLWKSTDSGVTWSQVTAFPDTGPYAENPNDSSGYQSDPDGVVWVTFDPASGQAGSPTRTIYVGVADNRSGASNLYRSTDGGATWAAIPGEPTCSVSGTTVTCSGGATWSTGTDNTTGYLPHQGKLDAQGTLYVTYSDFDGPYNGDHGDVWKFVPVTGTWTRISPVPGSDSANDYFGYGGLAVDLQHAGTLVVASVNSWWPDAQLFRSTNGGTSWEPIWNWASYPNRNLYYTIDASNAPWLNFGNANPVAPVPAVKLGWMMEGMNIDPFNANRMMYGTGATLYATNNLTAWDSFQSGGIVAFKSSAVGIEEEAVTDLVSPPANAHLYSTLGDVSGFRHDSLTTAPAAMYSIPYAGSYAALDYAELNPNFLVRVGYGNPGASPVVTSSAFSFDGGSSWFAGNKDISGVSQNGGTVAAAADASRVLWAPVNAQISYSTDNGNSWTAAANIPQNAVVAADRVNPKTFYGFGQGKFWFSTDGGATFTASAASGLPQAGDAVVIRAVAGRQGDVWLAGGSTTSGHVSGVWHSTDGGKTFSKLASVTQASLIGLGMAAPGASYNALYIAGMVGGVQGIYRSDDTGNSWVLINDSAHQYGIPTTLTGDPRVYGRVYVGTNGFGIVYGDIAGATGTPTPTPTATATATPSPTPTATPSPTPTATPSPTPMPGAACRVIYTITNQWPGGFSTNLAITNTGTTPINGWTLQFSFANGQTVSQVWNGTVSQVGSTVAITNLSYNGSIAPGASVGSAPGFNATWNGTNTIPTGFTLNGVACSTS